MTEKEAAVFEEKVVEHQRQVAERGYAERDGERFYEIETPYGKVWFITVPEEQKRLFRSSLTLHALLSSKIRIDKDNFDYLIFDPHGAEVLERLLRQNFDSESVEYIDKSTERAIKYFTDNLRQMFANNMKTFAEETLFHALTKTVAEVNPDPPQTESAVFTGFAKFATERMKSRLDIKKSSGRKPVRTDEGLREMLKHYDSILPSLREAKKMYTSVKGSRSWAALIKTTHPQIPIEIIEKFDLKGVKPSDLALMWVAEKFNTEATEYLRQEIIRIRKVDKGSA